MSTSIIELPSRALRVEGRAAEIAAAAAKAAEAGEMLVVKLESGEIAYLAADRIAAVCEDSA